ncbi:hypothetical protein D9M68_788600 [compost metagenome]
MPSCLRIRCRSSEVMAVSARIGSAAPDSTAQDWTMESMRHSSLSFEPSQDPSSNVARRYQAPSQASRSSAVLRRAAWFFQRLARMGSRGSAKGMTRSMALINSQPSQTLSPLPPSPTRFMPSFQSPVPMSGKPWAPVSLMAWSRPSAQCSNKDAERSEVMG